MISRFTQVEPTEGDPATELTEVRILIGREALYVGARMWDREAASIRRHLARRDEPVDSDAFEMALDSNHDHLTAFVFKINGTGKVVERVVVENNSGTCPPSCDDPPTTVPPQ